MWLWLVFVQAIHNSKLKCKFAQNLKESVGLSLPSLVDGRGKSGQHRAVLFLMGSTRESGIT